MKNFVLLLTVSVIVFSTADVSAQGAWSTYTSTRKVIDIAFQDEYIWCITEGGVVKWKRWSCKVEFE